MAHWSDKYTTVEITKLIRRLAKEGHTVQAAAEKIGLDTTKGMVASLAHRARPKITFKGNGSPNGKDARNTLERIAKKAASVPTVVGSRPKFVIVDEVYDSVHQLKLKSSKEAITDDRCRFPLWPHRMGSAERVPTSELMYCGAKTKEGTSWCEHHHSIVFEPPPPPVNRGEGRKRDQNGRRMGWEYGT